MSRMITVRDDKEDTGLKWDRRLLITMIMFCLFSLTWLLSSCMYFPEKGFQEQRASFSHEIMNEFGNEWRQRRRETGNKGSNISLFKRTRGHDTHRFPWNQASLNHLPLLFFSYITLHSMLTHDNAISRHPFTFSLAITFEFLIFHSLVFSPGNQFHS